MDPLDIEMRECLVAWLMELKAEKRDTNFKTELGFTALLHPSLQFFCFQVL